MATTTEADTPVPICFITYRVRSNGIATPNIPLTPARTLLFEGRFIVLIELKRRILYELGWIADEASANVDLLVSNAETGEEYRDDWHSIRARTMIIVRRVQTDNHVSRRLWMPRGVVPPHLIAPPDVPSASELAASAKAAPKTAFERLLAQRAVYQGASVFAPPPPPKPELSQSDATAATTTRDPTRRRFHGDSGGDIPRGTYRCHRCQQTGHFIANCPTNGNPAFDRPNNSAGFQRKRNAVDEHPEASDRHTSPRSWMLASPLGAPSNKPRNSVSTSTDKRRMFMAEVEDRTTTRSIRSTDQTS